MTKFEGARANAAMILEYSNICPFKYDKNEFACAYCSYTSPDFGPIKIHSREHKNRSSALRNMTAATECKAEITNLACEVCQEAIPDISTLFDHLKETHNKPLNKKYKPGILPYLLCDGFACADCGLKFDSFRNLSIHLDKHYPYFICPSCGQGFANELRLKNHLLNHEKPSRTYKCKKCDEIFPSIQTRRAHMTVKHNVYFYKCPYCKEPFRYYNLRVQHLNKYHNKNISFPCTMCPKVYVTATNLANHVRSFHMNDKRFECAECTGKFSSKFELQKHMVKHSSEKNFQCQVCKKSYARKKTLTEHMRIHNNDRRFVCMYCPKAFVQNCSLKGHMKTHHPDAQFNNIAVGRNDTNLKTKASDPMGKEINN